MAQWSGGRVAPGIVDNYPLPPKAPTVDLTETEIRRLLGVEVPLAEAARMLQRIEFQTEITGGGLRVTPPPFRMDIGEASWCGGRGGGDCPALWFSAHPRAPPR
jgi:phenylalanyl-tRNA synthetase beta chain